ncbi:unnamed protein product [Euphydryas editha]|uniref:Reverse transcriptase domain-containing protein n=1 Tax=Euphydryas editha TaxID=104508 RepID=A0AAU9UQ84_EUPED|nr:unnamed protein product [Euphydryas editha]
MTPIVRGRSKLGQYTKFTDKWMLGVLESFKDKSISKQSCLSDYFYEELSRTFRMEQFGFRSEHSTTLQLTRVLNLLASDLNWDRCTVGVFFDIKKAFDRLRHEVLVAKLLKTSLPRAIVPLLASFLANRQFFVAVENAKSGIRSIKAGVPQGS